MRIPSSKYRDWKAAEAELADIERTFKSLSADLTAADRARVTQQLAALRAARLRVLLLFEALKAESEPKDEPFESTDERPMSTSKDPLEPGAEDWLS